MQQLESVLKSSYFNHWTSNGVSYIRTPHTSNASVLSYYQDIP